jgi:tetratricopeptide (TPR) repeat protein
MNTTANTKVSSTIRVALTLVLTTALFACEDIPPPAPKTRPPVTAAPPPPQTTPPPVTPPPAPVVAPEVSKPEGIAEAEAEVEKDPFVGARKMLEAGEIDKALELAHQATLRTPKRSAAWNTLGRAQLRAGKRKAAIESFEKAVELNPSNSYAQNNLGLALIYDKRYDEAVDALEEAVELEPVESYMWNNLGMAYEQLDRLEEARDAYGKAVEMQSDRARDSLARLKGVESVIRTAKVDALEIHTAGDTKKETPTTTQ